MYKIIKIIFSYIIIFFKYICRISKHKNFGEKNKIKFFLANNSRENVLFFISKFLFIEKYVKLFLILN